MIAHEDQAWVVLPKPGALDYLAMARFDHWIKQAFIVPGIVLAYMHHRIGFASLLPTVAIGLLGASAIASANYVLNEWLDRKNDAFHPIKSRRPAVQYRLSPIVVALEYAALAAAGLALGATLSRLFLLTAALFLVSGVVYNVRPLRTKDRAFLDVMSEAVNNPIRLLLGWVMVDPTTLPPASVILAYWTGGGFLMTVKRLAEYRSASESGGLERLRLYRRSFGHYSEASLLVSAFLYALLAGFCVAVFLMKYRLEYLLTLPLFATLFASYLHIGLKRASAAESPEKLFAERTLLLISVLLIASLAVLTWVDIPSLEILNSRHPIRVPWPTE